MIRRIALALVVLFAAVESSAITIGFDPATSIGQVGDVVDVDLTVGGLGNLGPDSLAVYDLDIMFDPGIVSLNAVTFGSELSVLFASVNIATAGVGTVNLFELSLDSTADLDANQPGSFTIATLTFEIVDVGGTSLTTSVNTVGSGPGSALPVTFVGIGAVRGVPAPTGAVPEPSSAILWAAGLLAVQRRIRMGRC